jgi:hypothetical protein
VSPLAILPELIMDPTLEGEAVKVLGMLYELFAAKQVEGVDIELPALRESKIQEGDKGAAGGGGDDVAVAVCVEESAGDCGAEAVG